MLDIKLRHTALSVASARAQLIDQPDDSYSPSTRLEFMVVHSMTQTGQTTDDGRPIYLVDDLFIDAHSKLQLPARITSSLLAPRFR